MIQTTETIYLNEGDKINVAFPNGLPSNSNIDKGECGNWMTSGELKANRCTIIVNPQVATIISKKQWCLEANQQINILAICDEENYNIAEFLSNSIPIKKILVTPESFPKLMIEATKLGLAETLYNDWFCLLDESHCFASEPYRDNILAPFNYFFKFKKKAMGSATPFDYQDSRIQAMQKYKLVYPNKRGTVKILHSNKPQNTLQQMIKQNTFAGNVHIFLNSVTAINKIISKLEISDVNIYCADSERNRGVMMQNGKYFKRQPLNGEYAKYNFYTCRYIEGWDLIDFPNATMIFLTDTSIKHSMLSIAIKGVQCIGRLRNVTPKEIFHITNNLQKAESDIPKFKDLALRIIKQADKHINYYNNFDSDELGLGKVDDLELKSLIKPFSYIKHGIAYKHEIKLDQILYKLWSNYGYSNQESIKSEWQRSRYNTEIYQCDFPEQPSNNNRINTYQYVIEQFKRFQLNPKEYAYGEANEVMNHLKKKYNTLFQCYILYGIEWIEEIKFNEQTMKRELINRSNTNAQEKLMICLAKEFEINVKYSRNYIKNRLQELYDELNYLDKRGKVKKAKATDLEGFELFELKNCKVHDDSGKRIQGYLIEGKKFVLKQA